MVYMQASHPSAADASRPSAFQPERISQWLRSNAFSNGFSDTSLRILLNNGHCSRLGINQRIFEQGDPADTMFLVFEGEVELSATRLETGEERVVGLISAEAFFGELALLEKTGRSARAHTKTPCILMQIDTALFYRLLEAETRQLTRNLLLQANANLRRANERVVGEVVDAERRQIFSSVVQWLLEKKQDILTGMRLNAEMLASSPIPEEYRGMGETLVEQVDEFVGVFSAMHEFSSGSQSPLRPGESEVRSLFSKLEPKIKSLCSARQLHLDGYAERATVWLDENLVRKLITHLFYGVTPMAEPGSLIEFRVGRVGGSLEIRISYLHPGITEFQAYRLFEPFVSDGLGGRTGIDLALVRVWSEKMGGRAVLQQKSGDKVTLSIVLPLQEML